MLTSRLKQGAELLGIRLLDHLIFADERYYSFADQGWPDAEGLCPNSRSTQNTAEAVSAMPTRPPPIQ